MQALWHAFLAMSAQRHDGAPITNLALEAWERRMGVRLSPWESETLFDMDAAAIAALPAPGTKVNA